MCNTGISFRPSGAKAGQSCLECGIDQFFNAIGAHERIRAYQVDPPLRPGDDPGLGPAEEFVGAEADDVGSGGEALLRPPARRRFQ